MVKDFDRNLSDHLPLPLARLYRKAYNAEPGPERHENVLVLFQTTIKLAAAAQMAVYLTNKTREPGLDQSLTDLTHPALGHWVSWLRNIAAQTATLHPHPFPEVAHVDKLLRSKQKDLQAIPELLSKLGRRSPDARSVRFLDLIHALNDYRNDQPLTHREGTRERPFYQEMGDVLLNAAVEFLTRASLFGRAVLICVKEIRHTPTSGHIADLWTLMGSDALRSTESLDAFNPTGLAIHPGHVYLQAEKLLLDLYPFVVWDHQRPDRILLLKEAEEQEVRYADCEAGDTLPIGDLLPDPREILRPFLRAGVQPPPPPPPDRQAEQIAILYKRDAQPDEQVMQWLEAQLEAHGYRVFIDRHIPIGLEWAKEIERQVRASDAVIPLLSATAAEKSEMLASEVNAAHDESQKRQGKPRLLPVRLAFHGRLPEELARCLDPLQYFLWEGPQDNQRLILELIRALQNPLRPEPTSFRTKLTPPGGAVPVDDNEFYVSRPEDQLFHEAIARRDGTVLVKGPRQVGKTSLLWRGIQQAEQAGWKVVLTDCQGVAASELASGEAFYSSLSQMFADQLELDIMPDAVWSVHHAPLQNLDRYLRNEVLKKLSSPVVWVMDEADRLFGRPFSGEFFAKLRSWHNERARRRETWGKLTMVIAYSTETFLFITNLNESPFNIVPPLIMQDFTLEQVADLNNRYTSPLRSREEITQFYRLVGGQPFLVRRGLHEMVTRDLDFAMFSAQAAREEGPFGDHLRRLLWILAQDHDLCEAVREVLRGRSCADTTLFLRLRSAGVLSGDTMRDARLRCPLYTTYLERHLL